MDTRYSPKHRCPQYNVYNFQIQNPGFLQRTEKNEYSVYCDNNFSKSEIFQIIFHFQKNKHYLGSFC